MNILEQYREGKKKLLEQMAIKQAEEKLSKLKIEAGTLDAYSKGKYIENLLHGIYLRLETEFGGELLREEWEKANALSGDLYAVMNLANEKGVLYNFVPRRLDRIDR